MLAHRSLMLSSHGLISFTAPAMADAQRAGDQKIYIELAEQVRQLRIMGESL